MKVDFERQMLNFAKLQPDLSGLFESLRVTKRERKAD